MYYFLLYFFVYGCIGWCVEVAFAAVKEHKFVNRGFLNGPFCPVYGIGVGAVIMLLEPFQDRLSFLYILSVVLVTVLEWFTGFLLEKLFHSKWWDYSNMPLNLNGYVCLLFSLVWGVACVLIVKGINPLIFRALSLLPKAAGIVILTIGFLILIIDICVTVSGILKFNKGLEHMARIASEMRRISDDIGENIYELVVDALEKKQKFGETAQEFQERVQVFKEKTDSISADMKKRIVELKESYKETLEKTPCVYKRIFKAFPKVQSVKYKETFKDIKKILKDRIKK